MARPLSWLKDLHGIRKRLAETVRSHYTREEVGELFGVKQSQASALLRAMPTTKVANALVVKREDLAEFLEGVNDADDVPAFVGGWKATRAGVSRRKLRQLVRRDYDAMSVYGIPDALTLSRGHLEIDFSTADELADTMLKVAMILTDDLDEFTKLYEPERTEPQQDNTTEELRAMFADLRRREKAHAQAGRVPVI